MNAQSTSSLSLTIQTRTWMSPCPLLPKTLSLLSTFHGRWRWLRQNIAIYIYLYTVTNGVCPSLPFLSLSHDCPLGDSNDTAHPLGWLTWEISCVLHIIQDTAWLYGMPTAMLWTYSQINISVLFCIYQMLNDNYLCNIKHYYCISNIQV